MIGGVVSNKWVDKCTPDKWHFVTVEKHTAQQKHVFITFNGIDQIQVIRIASLRVIVFSKIILFHFLKNYIQNKVNS